MAPGLYRRPRWLRLLRFPYTLWRCYRACRSFQPDRRLALRGAWELAALTLRR